MEYMPPRDSQILRLARKNKRWLGMRLVHVGLPKTGTTTLQKHVFPEIAQRLDVSFIDCSDSRIRRHVDETRIWNRSAAARTDYPDEYIISCEKLTGFDPHSWERNAKALHDALGPSNTILITVRDPKSWLTSVYVQRCLHDANTIAPADFFLEHELYSEYLTTPKFDVSSFSYVALVDAFRTRFHDVVVVPIGSLHSLSFMEALVGTRVDIDSLAKPMESIRLNRSYSSRAVRLTLAYQRVLNAVGLSLMPTVGRADAHALQMARRHRSPDGQTGRPTATDSMQHRGSFAKKAARRLLRYARWRYFMQHVLDRALPYRRFELDFDAMPWIDIEALQREYDAVAGTLPSATAS